MRRLLSSQGTTRSAVLAGVAQNAAGSEPDSFGASRNLLAGKRQSLCICSAETADDRLASTARLASVESYDGLTRSPQNDHLGDQALSFDEAEGRDAGDVQVVRVARRRQGRQE